MVTIPHVNVEERKEYRRKYYKDNSELMKKRRLEYRKGKREYIDKYKIAKGCEICGYNKCAAALDFHHNGDKEFDIANKRNSTGIKRLRVEMDKCEVLCRNCHAEWHDKRK